MDVLFALMFIVSQLLRNGNVISVSMSNYIIAHAVTGTAPDAKGKSSSNGRMRSKPKSLIRDISMPYLRCPMNWYCQVIADTSNCEII